MKAMAFSLLPISPFTLHPFSPPPPPHHTKPAFPSFSTHFTKSATAQQLPVQDTRIHWSSPDEGWIGASSSQDTAHYSSPAGVATEVTQLNANSFVNDMLIGLISQASDSHYQFLGVPPNAELEEIKLAYRKLSKQYHPDSTSLPLGLAAEKFVRLREAYNILSSVEERRFYNWTLAQRVSRQQGGRFIWPYETDRPQGGAASQRPSWKSGNVAKVDSLNGRNMKLSDQAQTALAFDIFALFVSIFSIIYVTFFKH